MSQLILSSLIIFFAYSILIIILITARNRNLLLKIVGGWLLDENNSVCFKILVYDDRYVITAGKAAAAESCSSFSRVGSDVYHQLSSCQAATNQGSG